MASSRPSFPSVSSMAPRSADETEAHVSYAMVPSGPQLEASSVETQALAIEVIVRFHDTVLSVAHLSPMRSFTIGEANADVIVPSEALGLSKWTLVSVQGNVATVHPIPGAELEITANGRPETESGAGATAIVLGEGMRVRAELNGLQFETAMVRAGRKVAGRAGADRGAVASQLLSFGVHAAILGSLFAFMPALSRTEEGEMSNEQKYMLQAMLDNVEAEREREDKVTEAPAERSSNEDAGEGGQSKGAQGSMGSQNSQVQNKHYAVQGSARERTLNRQEALAEAQNFGMIDVLGNVATQQRENGPTSPWGSVADGPDSMSAKGALWGEEAGDSYGAGGLDLVGWGEGSGGTGIGVGVGGLDTIGRGRGTCMGSNCDGQGWSGHGSLSKGHKAGAPRVKMSPATVSGRLPAEVIQRVVRQNFGRFRGCYETGLRTNPNLQGRVVVGFTIGRDGAIGAAQNAGSDLPDSAVVGCIVKQFYGLSFPAPEAGVVTVTYPITLSPN